MQSLLDPAPGPGARALVDVADLRERQARQHRKLREDFFGRFGNRFLFLSGPKKRPISNPIEPDPFDMARIRKRLAALKELQPTRAVWTPAAAKEWDEFYNEIEGQERAGLMGAATKRLHVYARKLSMA